MEIDYTQCTDDQRMRSKYVGDPVGDYGGFPEVQRVILEDERLEHVVGLAVSSENDTE